MGISPEQARINGRKGGRPLGVRNALTLEREAVLEAWKQRTFRFLDVLQDSQMTLARGQTFLYRIDKEFVATGKGPLGGFYKKLRPVIVEDPEEIRNFIEREGEGSNPADDDNDSGSAYYYLTTKEPNNQAIDSMIDRATGKAIATTQHTGADGGPLEIKVVNYGEVAPKD